AATTPIFSASSPIRSRSVIVLIVAITSRKSLAVGARVARIRLHSSSIATSIRLTFASSSATFRPSSLSPSTSAWIARSSCSSTSPPIASTELRTCSRSALKRRAMWWPRPSTSIGATPSTLRRAGRLYDGPLGAAAQRDARGREMAAERAAATFAALDRQRAVVPLQRVLHDREPQAGAAGRARAARIDAIEALRDPRNLLLRNADAGVDHLEHGAVVREPPDDLDRAGRRREPDGVADQVVEDRVDLGLVAEQRRVGLERQRDGGRVRSVAELLDDRLEQRRDVDRLVRRVGLGRLEPRELDQVAQDAGHPLGLALHLRDRPFPALGQRLVLGERVQVSAQN